ncbi:MAG: HK97 family phage prohead protease [Rickettsiales bacterium]
MSNAKNYLSSSFSCKADSSEEGAFWGYASVFFVRDSQNDVVLPGAFKNATQGARTIPLLWQHRHDAPIGVINELREDAVGLRVKGKLNMEVAQAREANALLRSGAANGLSIGYEVEDHRYDAETDARLLVAVKLWEVSLVTFPANAAARAESPKSADPLSAREKILLAERMARMCLEMDGAGLRN